MLELSHNGVVILDAVIQWYQSSDNNAPFDEWWVALSSEQKHNIILQVLVNTFGEVVQS